MCLRKWSHQNKDKLSSLSPSIQSTGHRATAAALASTPPSKLIATRRAAAEEFSNSPPSRVMEDMAAPAFRYPTTIMPANIPANSTLSSQRAAAAVRASYNALNKNSKRVLSTNAGPSQKRLRLYPEIFDQNASINDEVSYDCLRRIK